MKNKIYTLVFILLLLVCPIIIEANEVTNATITFDGNGKEIVCDPLEVELNSYVTINTCTPEVNGYNLVGWYTSAENALEHIPELAFNFETTTIDEDITLYAGWEANNYTIIYNANGGAGSMANTIATYDQDINLLTNAYTRNGYKFHSWNTSADGTGLTYSNKEAVINLSTGEDITLYAQWGKKITVKFDANGGTTSTTSKTVYQKFTYETLPKPTRKGYTFKGWNTKADGTGETVTADTKVNKSSNITLYAKWVKTKYTLTYELNGGTNNTDNKTSYYVTTSTFQLLNPTRKGYTFSGWFTDSGFTKSITEIKKGSTGSKTLYAKWTANKYTISFNGNGNTSGTMNDLTKRSYNKSYTLTANGFKKKGYTFTGWNTKADGSGTSYANKASVKNLSSKANGHVTLYAQWKKTKYTLTYELNGGTNNTGNKTSYYITTSTFKLLNPTRNGYTFNGWFTDSGFTKPITEIKKGSTGSKTLYAKWTKKKYTISYVLNGGTNDPENKSTFYITTSTFQLLNPTKKGYTFDGWYKDSSFTQPITQIKKGSYGNKKLYAKWVANTYYIEFVTNDDSVIDDNVKIKCTYDKSCTLKGAIYTHPSLVLVSWNTKANNSGTTYAKSAKVTNLTSTNGKTVKLYAQYGVESKAPIGVKTSFKDIKITFDQSVPADGYDLYYTDSADGTFKKLGTFSPSAEYEHTNLKSNKYYYYKVRPYIINSDGKKVYSPYSKVTKVKTAKKLNMSSYIFSRYGSYRDIKLEITNKGSEPINVINLFDVYPYTGASSTTAHWTGVMKLGKIIFPENDTSYVWLDLEYGRVFSSGYKIACFLEYDDIVYFVEFFEDGHWEALY